MVDVSFHFHSIIVSPIEQRRESLKPVDVSYVHNSIRLNLFLLENRMNCYIMLILKV